MPTIFSKFANCIIGPEDEIVLPKVARKTDYEAEFAVVIGAGGRNIPEDKREDAVFGYMNLHDVSASDPHLPTMQWLMGKSIDTFCPIGPYTVMTLKPVDILTTGTPAGVGLAHKPPRWLRPGDECIVEVAGLGQLRNPVVGEA